MRRAIARRRYFRSFVLWTIGSVALMQLALGSIIDVALPTVRDPEFMLLENVLKRRLTEEVGKPTVMVLGSSRVENGFDAKTAAQVLDNRALVFNFGIPTSGPLLEKVWLNRLKAHGIKPDMLLIEVIPANFNSTQTPPDLRSLDGARLTAHELTRFSMQLKSTPGPIGRWAIGRFLPSYRHQAELRGLLAVDEHARGERVDEELLGIDQFGWRPLVPPGDFACFKRMAHLQYDACYRDFQLSPEQVNLLRQDITACRKQGIKTGLLLMPEGSEFRKLYSAEMSAAINGMLAQMHEQFQVPIVDARDWMDDACFFDMHHLLWEGAQQFSARLAREALAPMLRERNVVAKGPGP
jgi:Protein of unknown function (DUF1574)